MSRLNLKTWQRIVDASVFQIIWFICLIGGNSLALLATLLNFFLHLYWLKSNEFSRTTWLLYVFIGSLLGITIDQMAIYFGFFLFQESYFLPVWLVCLWVNFIMTIQFSLYWLEKHLWLSSVIGGIGGTYSYYLGEKLGQVIFPNNHFITISFLFVSWALLLPCLFKLKQVLFKKAAPI